MTDHPATFNQDILDAIADVLGPRYANVLDPFAGTGKVHSLATSERKTTGIEIEEEWAAMHDDTIVGSALALPFEDDTFDAIVTSPTYGNRMADQYDGRDGSTRATYRISLGRPLCEENSGKLQWGVKYRRFHWDAWREAVRVLRPAGRFVLNIKDHIRGGVVQGVTAWHIDTLESLGLVVADHRQVPCEGYGFGANADLRVDFENVIAFDLPVTHPER